MKNIFNKSNLKSKYLKELLKVFWFAPCDAFLRAPETAIWRSIKPKHPILDVGCADGKMDKYLFAHIDIDVGLDSNKKAINLAKQSGIYKKTVLSSANSIPFKSNYFGSVISNSTFEHIENDIASIREIHRVLRRKGDLIFTTTTDRFLKTMISMQIKNSKLDSYNKRVEHFHYRSIAEWKKILTESGFKVVYYRYYFPVGLMKIWWLLFKITTMKVYHRELWSYLKDSPYGKIFPSQLISVMLYSLLKNSYAKAYDPNGCWVFIWAKKV